MEITTLSQAKAVLVSLSQQEKQKLAEIKAFEAVNRLFLAMLRKQDKLKGNKIAAEHIKFLRTICFNGKVTLAEWTLAVDEETRQVLAYSLELFNDWRQKEMPDKHDFVQLHDIMLKELPCIKAFDKISKMQWYNDRIPSFFTNAARMSLSPPLY